MGPHRRWGCRWPSAAPCGRRITRPTHYYHQYYQYYQYYYYYYYYYYYLSLSWGLTEGGVAGGHLQHRAAVGPHVRLIIIINIIIIIIIFIIIIIIIIIIYHYHGASQKVGLPVAICSTVRP